MIFSIVMLIVSTVVSMYMAYDAEKKAKKDGGQAPLASAIPEVKSAGVVPILFGTKLIKGGNMVWYGKQSWDPVVFNSGPFFKSNFGRNIDDKLQAELGNIIDRVFSWIGL